MSLKEKLQSLWKDPREDNQPFDHKSATQLYHPGALESWQIFRSYHEHEDLLIDQRTNWFLASNAFLFASVGFRLRDQDFGTLAAVPFDWFILVSAVAGLAISIATFLSIGAAVLSTRYLKKSWVDSDFVRTNLEPVGKSEQILLPAFGGGGSRLAILLGSVPSLLLPISLAFGWGVLIYAENVSRTNQEPPAPTVASEDIGPGVAVQEFVGKLSCTYSDGVLTCKPVAQKEGYDWFRKVIFRAQYSGKLPSSEKRRVSNQESGS